MCTATVTAAPVNIPDAQEKSSLELNVTEAAYICACLAKFSSGAITNQTQDVYDTLLNKLSSIAGGSEEFGRIAKNREMKYMITLKG